MMTKFCIIFNHNTYAVGFMWDRNLPAGFPSPAGGTITPAAGIAARYDPDINKVHSRYRFLASMVPGDLKLYPLTMASQVMEIVVFNVQPIVMHEAPSLFADSRWNDALSTLTQQNGVRMAYWGQTIESQDKVYLLIDWISKQHCFKFKQSASFISFRTNLDLIALGNIRSIYVPIAPHAYPRIFHDGLTEIAIFSPYTSSFDSIFANFSSIIENSLGCTGVAKDIATNDISDEVGEIGGTEQLYVALIGWLDIPTHQIAMESRAFKDNVPLIEGSVQEITVYHIKPIRA